MALMLRAPSSGECIKQEGKRSFMLPKKSVIRFDFPARGSMPAVKLFWYDGCMEGPFPPEGLAKKQVLGDPPTRPPANRRQPLGPGRNGPPPRLRPRAPSRRPDLAKTQEPRRAD